MAQYSPEQLQKLYEELPKDLQEAIFSEQNATNIHQICVKKGVTDDDKISDAILNTGYVLIGLLSPSEFPKVLEKELEIETRTAQEIADEIKRFVFYPVRKNLEALYDIRLTGEEELIEQGVGSKSYSSKENPEQKDVYREPIG